MEIHKLLIALIVYGALLVLALIITRGARDPVRPPGCDCGCDPQHFDTDFCTPDCGCDPLLDDADHFI